MITAERISRTAPGLNGHRLRVTLFAVVLFGLVVWVAAHGFDYYRLPVSDRAFHPAHSELRPAGATGIRLGLLATLLFVVIYLYPFRKKFKFLRFIGSTKRVLDYHIVIGLAVPFVVALHAAFKFHGLAGMAFWIMLSVVASGIAGRYLYAQIPRTRKDTEFSFVELEQMRTDLAAELETRNFDGMHEWETSIAAASGKSVPQMSLASALFHIMTLDVRRPFEVAALRRRNLNVSERLLTLGGFLRSGHQDLERAIQLARKQSWLSAKIFFLDRAAQIFQLWHVIHRPFSFAFLVLAVLHIGMVIAMGFL